MARARTKDELITAANRQFVQLQELLASLPPAALEADFPPELAEQGKEAHWRRDKNCKDVIVHLYEWQRLWLDWVEANMAGEPRPFLPAPYTWNNYARMNEELRDRHADTAYREANALLKETHERILAIVRTLSDEELFTKKYFSFTGTTSLGSYTVSATSAHYEWAIKKIRKYRRLLAR